MRSPAEGTLHGVGGWLAFFVFSLGIVNPAYTAFSAYTSYWQAEPAFVQYPSLRTIVIVDLVVSALLMAFSVYAAVALLRLQQNAVRVAKVFLVILLIYSLLSPFAVLLAGLPEAATDKVIAAIAPTLLRPIIYFAIWFSYLSKSKRVKATYTMS